MTAGGTIGRDQLVGQVTDALKVDTTIRPFRIDIPEADLDDPELCPAHFAGSACGCAMSGKPSSTLSFERRFNPALRQHEGEGTGTVR